MAEDFDDDLFADVYAEDAAPQPSAAHQETSAIAKSKPTTYADTHGEVASGDGYPTDMGQTEGHADIAQYGHENFGSGNGYDMHDELDEEGFGAVGIKEDGKMFIGGLNWETTDESLRDYFSQFGEVTECTVMRDGASGRSRGFGFLTFKDPKTVNTVMVKEHFLDGKIIDPKRAIPREEQERTAKIFVGGVSPEATEQDFKNFFTQFGRVIDATLMMDKDTGRPRGFGFVTFDGDDAVDRALSRTLEIKGKQIEVKRAQPRSTLQAQAQEEKKFGRQPGGPGFGRGDGDGGFDQQQPGMPGAPAMGGAGGITPAVMAKYWHNMQQYFKMMQQQMTTTPGQYPMGMPNPMAGGMNPMMAGMMGMAAGGGAPDGSQMPNAQAAMMAQNMQQQQQQQQQQMMNQQGHGGSFDEQQSQMSGGSQDFNGQGQQGQNSFDREKHERREAQRMQQQQYQAQQAGYGTNWEGMYDDIPQQPSMGPGAQRGYGRGGFRGGRQQNTPPVQPQSNAPLNAPTGPKNAGRGGGPSYRGGGRGSHRGYHPYSR